MGVQNSNLPPSFVNEVVKIVEDETIVRSNLKSVSNVYSWIEEYGRTSDTKWNLRSSRPSGTRSKYKYMWYPARRRSSTFSLPADVTSHDFALVSDRLLCDGE
ncbi:hypothetical protein AVEN_131008-1 [Araneus ventricosus]|uniref:Uncharacterized protein n=1 Tax=Araneus ventricosus TaxID=182803 RepID=A0A4Y2M1B0_ARAVE|nr:hypothetical protein AVEN_102059-1 [Araneus ventricosus]GBN19506.1 hypothetical protein AVEN_131008-1 [Araneus ventricosus]